MSAMKPDGWCVKWEGEFCGKHIDHIYSDPTMYKPTAEGVVKHGSNGLSVKPLYTLATVRKWLEEVTRGETTYFGTDAVRGYKEVLAAKLREIENDT